jgi:hypothetical protein
VSISVHLWLNHFSFVSFSFVSFVQLTVCFVAGREDSQFLAEPCGKKKDNHEWHESHE